MLSVGLALESGKHRLLDAFKCFLEWLNLQDRSSFEPDDESFGRSIAGDDFASRQIRVDDFARRSILFEFRFFFRTEHKPVVSRCHALEYLLRFLVA